MLSRVNSLLIVLLIWAAIYLPALGSLEIKGEEGRRILPAIRMLETGDYIVPRVGSAAYFSKPPLVNWLVAASFKLFGRRSEWTARAPSVLCVLAVAIAFVTVARGSLGARGSTIAALIWQTKQWRSLFHPAHFIGIFVMLAIFAAWAIPFIQMTAGERVMNKWSGQFVGRITGEFFHFWIWILTIPHALVYFLPWLFFLPLVRFNKFRDDRQRGLARALTWSAAAPLIVINLIPGVAPRYSLPVLTPFCWLLALSFSENAFARPSWMSGRDKPLWSRVGGPLVGLAVAGGVIGYPLAAIVLEHRQKVKNVAAKMNAAVPQREILYAVDPNYQPFFFYMHAPVRYVSRLGELPSDTRYFLVRPDQEQDALASEQWLPRRARSILRVTDYRH